LNHQIIGSETGTVTSTITYLLPVVATILWRPGPRRTRHAHSPSRNRHDPDRCDAYPRPEPALL